SWYKNWANLYPEQNTMANWKFLMPDKNKLPLYLKKADQGVFYSFEESEKIAYFHINSFWDDCPNFKERVNDFNEKLKTKRDYNVVIDLRFHTGGDYTYSNKLATKPPKIINDDSKVFLITSNMTYSAAIVTAARVKYYAKEKIVVAGEEVGDRLKFWAESKACTLPNSGIKIYNPIKEHDWRDNKRNIFRTHFANFLYGVAAKDLKLDKEIGISFKDYQENKDPILEWIIKQK
ncbi:MAG: S41 family peptidase, partial [Bacteroidota bacterium]